MSIHTEVLKSIEILEGELLKLKDNRNVFNGVSKEGRLIVVTRKRFGVACSCNNRNTRSYAERLISQFHENLPEGYKKVVFSEYRGENAVINLYKDFARIALERSLQSEKNSEECNRILGEKQFQFYVSQKKFTEDFNSVSVIARTLQASKVLRDFDYQCLYRVESLAPSRFDFDLNLLNQKLHVRSLELFYEAIEEGAVKNLKFLIEQKAPVECPVFRKTVGSHTYSYRKFELSPLEHAAEYASSRPGCDVEVFRVLIENGANITVKATTILAQSCLKVFKGEHWTLGDDKGKFKKNLSEIISYWFDKGLPIQIQLEDLMILDPNEFLHNVLEKIILQRAEDEQQKIWDSENNLYYHRFANALTIKHCDTNLSFSKDIVSQFTVMKYMNSSVVSKIICEYARKYVF